MLMDHEPLETVREDPQAHADLSWAPASAVDRSQAGAKATARRRLAGATRGATLSAGEGW